MKLDQNKALHLLSDDGPLSSNLKGFESRPQQQEMMLNIIDAYNENHIALIEAGTGTGKSIAYLIPAILWARYNGEKTVISTNTINLQEQLIHKDIPIIAKAANIEVKAVLVKGMRNYLCLRKLEEARTESLFLPPEEAHELFKLEQWANNTTEGSRSSLPFVPTPANWDRVCAENDTCTKNKCPYYQDCYFFKARKQAEDAHILVVNHHLLFADLSLRGEEENYKDPAVLPAYSRVILDEAHHIEDVATEYFADNISRLDLLRSIGRLAAEKQGKTHGKLTILREKILEHFKGGDIPTEITPVMTALNLDLPAQRQDLLQLIIEAFDAFNNFLDDLTPRSQEDGKPGENKLRILPMHATHPDWPNKILPKTSRLSEGIKRYVQSLDKLCIGVKQFDNDRLKEATKGIVFETAALGNRLLEACTVIENFVKDATSTKVKWIESQALKMTTNVALINAELEINKALADFLFSKMQTVVLCSATLTTNKNFDFVRQRLGLVPELLENIAVSENAYESPFNFQQQALLAVPTDLPEPSSAKFTEAAAEKIFQAIEASHGSAFVLFTSYTMLKTCHQMLEERLKQKKYSIFKQGDDNRQNLLQKFKTTTRAVLFGTDSFWEGVDVAGEALRCVIIVKLPFKVPSEPIIQARTEAIAAQGGDPFMEYSLPNAIVKFKQGFGRLIRTKRDRGCIVCLDTRLLTKRYGQEFLDSLPPCQRLFVAGDDYVKAMTDFYKKTYAMTLK